MNNITERIWDYIDGNCSAEERTEINYLIEHDDNYQRVYAELQQLHNEFDSLELDEPPMAFTYHVMEQIRTQNANVPLKSAVNKYLIRGIAALFICSILVLFIFMLTGINWSVGHNASSLAGISKLTPNIKYITGSWLTGFLLVDVVLGLFLLDTYWHKYIGNKHHV